MPRVSAAHEYAVRQRIIDAAVKVFGENGYQTATVQDVVRASGLSVGAVYTHFKSKEELFLVACAGAVEAQKAELRGALADIGTVGDRLRVAVDFAIASTLSDESEHGIRIHAWTAAENSPELRQILRDRRTEMVAFARMILQEARIRGELPEWIDADSIASAWITLIDGFVIRSAEAGGLSIDQARREAYSLLELLVAAPAEKPASVDALRGASRK